MRLIIHDLTQEEFDSLQISEEKDTIISDNGTIHNCIGCFGCWIKTPGVCILKDGYQNMGELLSKCTELTIISQCVYGSYSSFVRNVLDRSIPYLLPYFVKTNGETHHKPRYNNHISLSVHFYGDDITPREQSTAKALVHANGINFYTSKNNVFFYHDSKEIRRGIQ